MTSKHRLRFLIVLAGSTPFQRRKEYENADQESTEGLSPQGALLTAWRARKYYRRVEGHSETMHKGSFSPSERYGASKSGIACSVGLLDGSECVVEVNVSTQRVRGLRKRRVKASQQCPDMSGPMQG